MIRIAALVVLLLYFSGCSGTPESKETKVEERKLETYQVVCQEISTSIEATGTVQPDIEGSAKIISYLPGTIENIYVKVGDGVKRGDPLCAIRSPDVSDTYSNYLANLSQVKQAERVYGLNKQLFEVGAVTKNDLLTSEANYEQTKVQSEALKKKLEIYGVSTDSGFSDRHTIKCPMDGSIVEVQGHVGDRVDTTTSLMSVADPKKVVVVANLYDTDIHQVHKGKQVIFTTDIFPNDSFQGIVKYISDSSDPETKTVKTYIQILNEPGRFKHNMFMKIKIGNGKKRLPVVPKTALLYKDGKFSAYLKKGEKFELQEVNPYMNLTDKQIAVEGLREGDIIISSAIEMERT